jgi:membrane protein DedA with SNARE-associated domain
MSLDSVTHLLIQYRYLILIPLTFLEGPIVAFVAGTLASLGYFNMYALATLFFVRDVTMDLLCYATGHWGWKMGWVRRWVGRMGVTEEHLGEVQVLWNKYGFRTMFFSKLSYGIAAAFIIVAGVVHMPIKKFITYGAIVTVLQYGSLLFLGYFLGNAFGGTIQGVLEKLQYVLLLAAAVLIAYYFLRRYMRRRLEKQEREVNGNS